MVCVASGRYQSYLACQLRLKERIGQKSQGPVVTSRVGACHDQDQAVLSPRRAQGLDRTQIWRPHWETNAIGGKQGFAGKIKGYMQVWIEFGQNGLPRHITQQDKMGLLCFLAQR